MGEFLYVIVGFGVGYSGYTESLDDSTEIVVPQDDYGLYAIDILDPSVVCFASSSGHKCISMCFSIAFVK